MIKLDAGEDNDIYADSRFKLNVNYIRLVHTLYTNEIMHNILFFSMQTSALQVHDVPHLQPHLHVIEWSLSFLVSSSFAL